MNSRYFTNTTQNYNKFWDICVHGSSFTVSFGRIGTDGRRVTKSFDSNALAQHWADVRIGTKLRNGYIETETIPIDFGLGPGVPPVQQVYAVASSKNVFSISPKQKSRSAKKTKPKRATPDPLRQPKRAISFE